MHHEAVSCPLHPTTAVGIDSVEPEDLDVYKRFLIQFLGEPVRSSFVGPDRSKAFIFKTYIDTYEKGLKAVLRSAFQEVFEIAKNQALILNTHPAEWTKALMTLLVSAEKLGVRNWIKRVCDKENLVHSSIFNNEDVFWGTWRAPRFIHMQPSGNTPYDEATAWTREDMAETEELLEGRAQNLVTFLLIELDRTAGSAHIEFAKGNGRSPQASVASSSKYNSGVISAPLRGTPGSEKWHALRERFQQLGQEELDCAPNNANDRWLRAHGDYQPLDITTGQWHLNEGLSEGFKERFELEATRAGISLESSLPGEPRDIWLHQVFMDLFENKSKLLMGANKTGGVIVRICEASAIYCARLEKRALTDGKSSLASTKVNGIDAIPDVAGNGQRQQNSSFNDESQANREAAIKKVHNPQTYTVLTISEAALYFEVEPRTIHRWLDEGKLTQGVRRGSVTIRSIVKYEKKRSRKRKPQ
jgi:hypothetical protein